MVENGVELSWIFQTSKSGALSKDTGNFFELLQGSTFAQSQKKNQKGAFLDYDVRTMNQCFLEQLGSQVGPTKAAVL